MPFSYEKQLKFFDPHLFEELCAQLIKNEFEDSYHLDPAGGDEGIDIAEGPIDEKERHSTGKKLRVWQVKNFSGGIKESQKAQIVKSLNRVISTNQPDHWTLCIPVNLDIKSINWFDQLKRKYKKHGFKMDTWDSTEILKRIRKDQSLMDLYFFKPQKALGQSDLQRILNRLDDFTSVPKILTEEKKRTGNPEGFYNGTIPKWSDIAHEYDAPREKFNDLWKKVSQNSNNPGGRIPLILITGRSGDGKSTLLMRLAARIVERGNELVFICKDNAFKLGVEQFEEIPKNQVSYIFIDKIVRFPKELLHGFFERLCRESMPVVVIAAEIRSIWANLDISIKNTSNIHYIDLEEMTDFDIISLLNKLSADEKNKDKFLGELSKLSREEQISVFKDKAKRQLLVALLEAKYNEEFRARVCGEIERLTDMYGEKISHTCAYISALHRLDIPMPRTLLEKVVPTDDLLHVCKYTTGLLSEIDMYSGEIVTRHPLVADILFRFEFDNTSSQVSCYKNIIESADPKNSRLITRMLQRITLMKENDLAKELLIIGTSQFGNDVIFLHISAMLMNKLGATSDAKELLKKITKIQPENAPTWQAWALMEKDQGNFDEARKLFEKGVKADPSHAYLWQAWALMERSLNNHKKACELFGKLVEIKPTYSGGWYCLADTAITLGNTIKAKEILENAVVHFPQEVSLWLLWAKLEKSLGNVSKAKELLLKSLEHNQKDASAWYFLAKIEEEEGNTEQASYYFDEAEKRDKKKE